MMNNHYDQRFHVAEKLAILVRSYILQSPNKLSISSSAGLGGHSGCATLFAAMSLVTGDPSWAEACYTCIARAATDKRGLVGLFSGYSGLLFASSFSRAALGDAVDPIIASVSTILEEYIAQQLISFETINDTCTIDLIHGLAGARIALHSVGRVVPALDRYFEWLCEDDCYDKWSTSVYGSDHLGSGWINIGLSHGLSGIIAASSICGGSEYLAGAINLLCGSVMQGGRWPGAIRASEHMPSRQAWCYGTPGIAAVLAQFGVRVNDETLVRFAAKQFQHILNSGIQTMHLSDASVCHGLSGLALTAQSLGRSCADQKFFDMARDISERIAIGFNPAVPFGYESVLANGTTMNDPFFLTGATGIALTLGTLASAFDSNWTLGIGLLL